MPERSALTMPCPEIGSQHDKASPTAMNGRSITLRNRRDPAATIRGASIDRSPFQCRRAKFVAPSASNQPSTLPRRRRRTMSASVMQPSTRRWSGNLVENHHPSCTASISVSRMAALDSGTNETADQPVAVRRQTNAEPPRHARRAAGGVHQNSGARNSSLPASNDQPRTSVLSAGDRGRHDTRDIRGGVPHHAIEPAAIQPPASLMHIQHEFIAGQHRRTPGGQAAIGRIVPVRGNRRHRPRC